MRYKQAAGVFYGSDDIGTLPLNFHNRKAVFAIDLEKTGNQSLYSGYSTRDGAIVSLKFTNSGLGAAGDFALIYLCYDGIVSLLDGSVEVLE